MAIERTIEIESINFVKERHGTADHRVAKVLWRVSTPGGTMEFTIPMSFFVNEEIPEEKMVTNAKAAFHALTTDLAEQTKPWAGG